jgi:hypothetical protein
VLESEISNAGVEGSKAHIGPVQRGKALAGYNRRTVDDWPLAVSAKAKSAWASVPMPGPGMAFLAHTLLLQRTSAPYAFGCGTSRHADCLRLTLRQPHPEPPAVSIRLKTLRLRKKQAESHIILVVQLVWELCYAEWRN